MMARSLLLGALCAALCAVADATTFDFKVDQAVVSLPVGTSAAGVKKVCADHNLVGGQCAILDKAFRAWEATAAVATGGGANDDAHQPADAIDKGDAIGKATTEQCANDPSSTTKRRSPREVIKESGVNLDIDLENLLALVSAIAAACVWLNEQREQHKTEKEKLRLNEEEARLKLRSEAGRTRAQAADMLSILERYVLLADWAFDRCQALTIEMSAALDKKNGKFAGDILVTRDAMWEAVAAVAADTLRMIVQEKLDTGHKSLSGNIPAVYGPWRATLRTLRKDFDAAVIDLQRGLQDAVYQMREGGYEAGKDADPDAHGTLNVLRSDYRPAFLGNRYREQIKQRRDAFNRVVSVPEHPYQRLRAKLLLIMKERDDDAVVWNTGDRFEELNEE